MLTNLLLWLYISFISYCFAGISIDLFGYVTKRQFSEISLPSRMLLGISVISFLLAGISILAPISWATNIIFLSISVIYLIATWRHQKKSPKQDFKRIADLPRAFLVSIGMISLILLFQSSVGPFNYDTGLYHGQAVAWNNLYPSIPGLGNLHGRLAFNSLIFLPFSLFDFHFLFINPLHSLNGWILLMCLWFSFEGMKRILQGDKGYDAVFQALIILPLIGLIYDADRFSVEVASFSNDLAVSALSLVIVSLSLAYKINLEKSQNSGQRMGLIMPILVLSLFAVMTKLSAAPLLLIAGYILIQEIRLGEKYSIIYLISFSGLAFIPHLIRNFILSGYLIYPVASSGWFNVDWKIPKDLVLQEKNAITTWARVPDAGLQALVSNDIRLWFPVWLGSILQQWEAWVFIGAMVLLVVACLLRPRVIWQNLHPYKAIWLILIFALGLWWVSAPDIRFAYGWMMAMVVLGLAVLLQPWLLTVEKCTKPIYGLIGIALLISLWNFNFFLDDVQFLISPMPFPQVPTVSQPLGSIKIFQPTEGDQCWLSAFPCTPYIQPGLELRGESVAAGFRVALTP